MLSFETLRKANALRLPQFKNAKGERAHTTEDGHDWSPAQWFAAMVGEVGEFATIRIAFERGEISFEEYKAKAASELADIITYCDILARRSLDEITWGEQWGDHAQTLMLAISHIGEYANMRKKFDRREVEPEAMNKFAKTELTKAIASLQDLRICSATSVAPKSVEKVHDLGVDLGEAVYKKFNEVSQRVNSSVRIGYDEGAGYFVYQK